MQQSYDIAEFLRWLHPIGVFELRALKCPVQKGKPFKTTHSGYFNDHHKATEEALRVDELGGPAVYVTINSLTPELLASSNNRIKARVKTCATRVNVLSRSNIFIDADVIRSGVFSATDEEVELALAKIAEIRKDLIARGFPAGLVAMSGNGAHLVLKVDMPADKASDKLVSGFLAAVAREYSDDHVKIDLTVRDPSRLIKLAGTMARKGDNFVSDNGVPDRPHRRSWFEPPPVGADSVTPTELITEYASAGADADASEDAQSAPKDEHLADDPANMLRFLDWVKDEPEAVSGKGGHNQLFHVACRAFRMGLSESDARAGLWIYNATLTEPFNEDELEHKLSSAQKVVQSSGEFGADVSAEDEFAGLEIEPPPKSKLPAFVTELITSVELERMDVRNVYLVKDVLVEGQPMVMGGRGKSLKTSIAIDLALSLGSGLPFLGQFETRRRSVAFWCGESGEATTQETARRIARSKGTTLGKCSVTWGFDLPRLADASHLRAMVDVVREKKFDVLIVDPLYLSLASRDTASSAGNIFAMGAVLQPLAEMIRKLKVTIILLHHFRKSGVPDPEEPASLEELSQSGVAEWARQWILLQRRSPYQGRGYHELYMRCGGSAGHAGLHGLNVTEGLTDPDGLVPRKWELEVSTIEDIRREQAQEKDLEKRAEKRHQDGVDEQKVIKALKAYPDGNSLNKIRARAGMRADRTEYFLEKLISNGAVEIREMKLPGWSGYGYILVGMEASKYL